MSHSAIISFGMYLPAQKIKVDDIAIQHGHDPENVKKSIGVEEKTVASADEDSFTMAYEAATQALAIAEMDPKKISALFVGSESHPYAVKPTSGMLAHALEIDAFCSAADLEFACKAGTAGMQIVDSLIRSKQVTYGLAVGTDTAQGKPGDALEYTAAAGAAAILMGPTTSTSALCRIDQTLSFTTDTPDFWRANGADYPEHAGRFTGEPAYFHHIKSATDRMLQQSKLKTDDIDHVIFHMPNGKFPKRIARQLGFTQKQLETGLIVQSIGNTYSACSMLGLTSVLQKAKKDDSILLVSYGSGAGSDAFLMTMMRDGVKLPRDKRKIRYLSYAQYLQSISTKMTQLTT